MSIIETQENMHSKGNGSTLSRFGNRISNPHPGVVEIGDRRRAQLLAGLSLTLVLPLSFGIILRFLTNDPSEWFQIETFEFFGLVLFALLAYILSRTPYFNWGSISLVTAFSITAIVNSFANNTVEGALFFLIPAFVIGSALLRLSGIVALVFINVAILFILPIVFPSIEQSFSDTGIVLTSGLLLVLVVAVRNLIEHERLAEVENVNEELRSLQSSLEQRVANATRNLELAAEVGQRLSLVRETNIMLTEAVQIIGERFDFYYTQVYLTDPTGRALVLRAGTGETGQTLVRRGHRLPVDMSSLNGIAATERRPIIVEDTETSPIHRFNPLLPDTRSEMVVPLLVGARVVGVLDMQSSRPGALSGENLPAFEALAGQLAISIANAGLFEEAERARSTVEAQARRLTSEGWHDFMDAIERSERFAYTYDLENVTPFVAPLLSAVDETTLEIPIQVSGEPVGTFQLERETGWTEDDQAMVNTVAHQVAQQIENMRLLAQAEQYQAEAQEALQRLTREGWEQYQEQYEDKQIGFVYSDYEVKTLDGMATETDRAVSVPLTVRDETIGELEVLDAATLSEEDTALLTYVKEQLSTHLENIRLATQTEQALARTDELYGISQAINAASTEAEILEALARPAAEAGASSAILMYLDLDKAGNPEWTEIVADWRTQGQAPIPVGTRFFLPEMPLSKLWMADPNNPLLISDVRTDERVDDVARGLMEQGGSRALVIVPLTRGREQVATLIFNWDQSHEFSTQEEETYRAIIGLASPAVQSRRLFEQTQTALADVQRSEETLREVSGLQTAILEGAEYAIITTTPEGILTTFNPGAENMLGYKAEDLINKESPAIFHDLNEVVERAKLFSEELGYEIEPGFDVFTAKARQDLQNEYEWTYIRKDGSRFPVLLTVTALRNADHEITGFLGIASDITEQKKAQEATAKRAAELATVADVGTAISTILEERQLLETVVQLTQSRFDLYHCHIFLADENNQTLKIDACGWDADSPHIGTHEEGLIHTEQEQSLVAQAARDQIAVIVNDVRAEPNWLPNELLPNTNSEMAVPMIAGNQVLGVLDVQADEVERFSDEDISIMTTLASQVAVALQNARTYAQTQQQAEHEAMINLISQRIQSTTSVENALQVAIRELGRALGAKRTNVQLGLPNEKKPGD